MTMESLGISDLHKPKSEEAEEAFSKYIDTDGHVISMAIHVGFLYGEINIVKAKAKHKKTKRDAKLQELLKNVTAARNSNSGTVLIHLVGLGADESFTGAFDEFADEKLNSLTIDGELFADVYRKSRLSDYRRLTNFTDFLVLTVKSSPIIVTTDFKTKIALDDRVIDASREHMRSLLRERKKRDGKYHTLPGSDLSTLQESRCIQMKSDFITGSGIEDIVTGLFHELKLPYYISAFTKNDNGGSYLFGVNESNISRDGYKSKRVIIQGRHVHDPKALEERIHQIAASTLLLCNYDGHIENHKDLIKINFIPLTESPKRSQDAKSVLHISVRSANGLVFCDKQGPIAYRYDEKRDTVSRFEFKDWFHLFTRQLKLLSS